VNERGKFPSQYVINPRGTTQDNIFAVENILPDSWKLSPTYALLINLVMEFNIHLIQNFLQGLVHLLPLLQFPHVQPNSATTFVSNHSSFSYLPRVPYSDRHAPARKTQLFEDIRKVFENVHINFSFLTAIQQVLAYFKFLKDLCTIKRTTQVLWCLHCHICLKFGWYCQVWWFRNPFCHQ